MPTEHNEPSPKKQKTEHKAEDEVKLEDGDSTPSESEDDNSRTTTPKVTEDDLMKVATPRRDSEKSATEKDDEKPISNQKTSTEDKATLPADKAPKEEVKTSASKPKTPPPVVEEKNIDTAPDKPTTNTQKNESQTYSNSTMQTMTAPTVSSPIENTQFSLKGEPDSMMTGMSQSERKRYREKKRRSEITNAIDQLTKILLKVEPANLIQQNNLVYSTNSSDIPHRSGRSNSGHSGASQQPLNRTEIINHAVSVLERLFRENEERKLQIMRLHSMVNDVTSGGNQMMMMSQPQMIYQTAPQAKLTHVAAPNTAFANAGTIPTMQVPIQMQQHPSFMQPTAFQMTAATGGAPVDNMPKGMMMPTGPNNNPRTPFEQLYFTQQILGQQQMMREQGSVGK